MNGEGHGKKNHHVVRQDGRGGSDPGDHPPGGAIPLPRQRPREQGQRPEQERVAVNAVRLAGPQMPRQDEQHRADKSSQTRR